MIKLLFTVLLCALHFISQAQDASVEKSTFGVQTGYLGFWLYHEAKLSPQIALRSEIGLAGEYRSGGYYDNSWLLMGPTFTLEPRWYYNLKKRNEKGKNTVDNSANFISLNTRYIPDWFYATNNDDLIFLQQLSIIPTWE